MNFEVLHETTGRLRLRLPPGIDEAAARVALELLAGVGTVRVSLPTRSLVVHYDGRAATRRALLDLLGTLPPRSPAADEPPRRDGSSLPLPAPALLAALMPLLPPPLRPPAALLLVLGHGIARWRRGFDPGAVALDGLAL